MAGSSGSMAVVAPMRCQDRPQRDCLGTSSVREIFILIICDSHLEYIGIWWWCPSLCVCYFISRVPISRGLGPRKWLLILASPPFSASVVSNTPGIRVCYTSWSKMFAYRNICNLLLKLVKLSNFVYYVTLSHKSPLNCRLDWYRSAAVAGQWPRTCHFQRCNQWGAALGGAARD